MKKYLTIVVMFAAILSIGLMIGCEENPVNSGSPPTGNVAQVEVRVQHGTLRGIIGEERTMEVTAIARNSQNVAVPGVKIDFAIRGSEEWRGTIADASETDTSDINGVVKGIYSVVLNRAGSVTIDARSGQITGSTTINLEVIDNIVNVHLEGPSVIAAAPNQTRQTQVTAIVSDAEGVGMSDILVRFRTSPVSLGTVDSDTGATDFNGRVSKTFSTVPNRYGICQIIAQIGDSVATHSIEVIPVSEPEYINLHTDTPIINVADGQNASVDVFAVVTDVNRVGVPETTVEFLIEPFVPGGPTFGVIAIADTSAETGENGQINAQFRTLGGDGKVYIVARVLPTGGAVGGDPISTRILIQINKLPSIVGNLSVRANPNFLRIAPDTSGTSLITAVVRNLENNGLPNVQVNFQTDLGSLARPTLTDSSGQATVEFSIVPGVDFNDQNDVQETATIVASLPGTNLVKTAEITIEKFTSDVGVIELYTDRTEIYADMGVTVANLSALLKDADGQVMANQEVVFTSDYGAVNSPVTTDSSGIARATFSDIGIPSMDIDGNIVPAVIFAKFAPMGLEAVVEVTILEQNPVSQISLQAAAQQMIAGRGDSTQVTATCIQENGDRAADGTQVTFMAQIGYFVSDQVYVSGGIGTAQTFYVGGQRSGTEVLRAYVVNAAEGDTTWSNEVFITLLPGPPNRVSITANPNFLQTNDPEQYSEIVAVVVDTSGNAVATGTLVNFTATLGQITASAVTDTAGRAKVRLTTGVNSGFSTVTATVNVAGGTIEGITTVEFIAGNPNSIELTASPLEIQVAGTGGVESATLFASVKDPNGNPISGNVPVYFELIRQPPPPRGCNINQHGQLDSAFTQNGIARATLNSGTQSGGVLIRAYTWRDIELRDEVVQVTNSTVQVQSGPPELLDIDVNEEGTDAGGGTWQIEVSARVYDFYRNPVANNIPVAFTVEPDIATIDPGHTGNESLDGESIQGLAYALMTYNSNNTFDTLSIIGIVETEDGQRTGEVDHVLPLQDGDLQLNVAPVNHMFDRDRPNDLVTITCFCVLQDGHQVLVNNGPVLFTTTRADLYYRDFRGTYYEYEEPEPAIKYTGWRPPKHPNYNEDNGIATVYLRGVMDDFFLDPFTLEVTVQIDAGIIGYDDVTADPGFIFMTRH